MKIKMLTVLASVAILISTTLSVKAQACLPVSNLTADRVKQGVAVTWQNPQAVDAVLCYRWTLQQWGWQLDSTWTLSADVFALADANVVPSKIYQYAVTVHYPTCGWAPWQYVVVQPYSTAGTKSLTGHANQTP